MDDDNTAILSLRDLPQSVPEENHRSPMLLVLTGSQAGRMFKVGRQVMSIGRGADASVQIDDDGVSRRHAEIHHADDGSVILRDLQSTNGTFCNAARVHMRALQEGDKVQVGTTTILKFQYQDELEEQFQRRQYESATRDGLTDCFNKKYFLDRLHTELGFTLRHGQPLALALFDIDHFKAVNDRFGHPAGDVVLRQVAKTVQAIIRSADVLARYGGEEFAIIMRNTPAETAVRAAERVRTAVEALISVHDERHINVTISIGLASVIGADAPTAKQLIQQADEHLYRAKRNGRNRIEA